MLYSNEVMTSPTVTNTTPGTSSTKNLSHVPCKFYKQGICQAGSSCPFSHNLLGSLAADKLPCKYFQKGNCKFGLKCALAHYINGERINRKIEKPRYYDDIPINNNFNNNNLNPNPSHNSNPNFNPIHNHNNNHGYNNFIIGKNNISFDSWDRNDRINHDVWNGSFDNHPNEQINHDSLNSNGNGILERHSFGYDGCDNSYDNISIKRNSSDIWSCLISPGWKIPTSTFSPFSMTTDSTPNTFDDELLQDYVPGNLSDVVLSKSDFERRDSRSQSGTLLVRPNLDGWKKKVGGEVFMME